MPKTKAQLDAEIAKALATPRRSGRSGLNQLSRAELAALNDRNMRRVPYEPHLASALAKLAGKRSHVSKKAKNTKPQLRVAYRLQLTPSEMRAVEFVGGRYSWPEMLSAHASEGGLVAFTEPEMWQWTDDVDSDSDGEHSPFPMASVDLAEKLQNFYDERV